MTIEMCSSSRYGLPVNFAAIVLHPTRKSSTRLRNTLDRLYGYLDQSNQSRSDEVNAEVVCSSYFDLYLLVHLANRYSRFNVLTTRILFICVFQNRSELY